MLFVFAPVMLSENGLSSKVSSHTLSIFILGIAGLVEDMMKA